MADPIVLERDGTVAHLILNRPEKLNALDLEALSLLRGHVEQIASAGEVRVIVIRGEGRAFCTGVDLDLTGNAVAVTDGIAKVDEQVHATFGAIEAVGVPTLAAVHGLALAGGLELVQVCDLAVAADDAKFGDHHARYGLFPGGGATQRLPRLIGERRAKWLLLSGEWIDAETARQTGLVNEVVPTGRLIDRANEMAQLLASRSPLLSAAIKQTIREGAKTDLDTALARERPLMLRCMASEDAHIGLRAFATRTEPQFVGR